MNIAVEEKRVLLENVLPFSVQQELSSDNPGNNGLVVHTYPSASIFFCDMVSFTTLSSTMDPSELVYGLNYIFAQMDEITALYGVEKIKTIGDSYMATTGLFEEEYEAEVEKNKFAKRQIGLRKGRGMGNSLPELYQGNHAQRLSRFAIHIRDLVKRLNKEEGFPFRMRFGIHSGPVVAGVIGIKKFQFDVWGDTVNTASRMESTGIKDNVHVSEVHATLLMDRFILLKRDEIE